MFLSLSKDETKLIRDLLGAAVAGTPLTEEQSQQARTISARIKEIEDANKDAERPYAQRERPEQ